MDLVPGIPSQDAARPVESHESQEISESLMKIEDSCSKQAADNKLISDLSTIKTPEGRQTQLEQVQTEQVPEETEEQAHLRKSKLFEMALSAISVASLRFTVAPAQNSQDIQNFDNVKRRLNFDEVKFQIESRPSIEQSDLHGK